MPICKPKLSKAAYKRSDNQFIKENIEADTRMICLCWQHCQLVNRHVYVHTYIHTQTTNIHTSCTKALIVCFDFELRIGEKIDKIILYILAEVSLYLKMNFRRESRMYGDPLLYIVRNEEKRNSKSLYTCVMDLDTSVASYFSLFISFCRSSSRLNFIKNALEIFVSLNMGLTVRMK